MTKYRITHTIKPDDVAPGLVVSTMRAVAFALCQRSGKDGALLDLSDGLRLSTGVYALNIHEALRTADAMAGAAAPLVAAVSVAAVEVSK